MHTLRSNDDGTMSLLVRGRELLRGKPPRGTGISGFQKMHHLKAGPVLRCLNNNARFFRRAMHLDTFDASVTDDGDHVTIAATWRNGGAWGKTYPRSDLPAACALRRLVLAAVLEAREPVKG